MRRPFTFSIFVVTLLAMIAFISGSEGNTASASHAGGMDAMSIDMDPDNAPANTATSLGTREVDARVNGNNILDADEDLVDSLIIDITATNVPVSNPMIGFAYNLVWGNPPAPDLCVVAQDPNFLLASGGGTLFNPSEATPDCDGRYGAAVLDQDVVGITGSGVLHRLTLETQFGVASAVYPLTFDPDETGHVDTFGLPQSPDALNNAYICINTSCDDHDNDGVLNVDDLCPDTPTGEAVDPGGCSLSQVDQDGDGVCNPGTTSVVCTGEDACPDLAGTLANDGCPPPGPPAVGGITGLLDGSNEAPPSAGTTSPGAYPWVALAALVPVLAASGWLAMRFVRVRRRIR